MEKEAGYSNPGDFRNKITTVDKKGKRSWLYVLKPEGSFYKVRTWVSVVYLLLFFSLPFVKVHGSPFFLFNITEARFVFFGKAFLPQDFILLGTGMLVFLLFVIVFTLAFGRVFCGWACPQTIFMEMVFRKIEYWIEGSAARQRVADKSKWTSRLIARKALKHAVFFILSFIIANTFLSYIIGIDELRRIITEPVSDHLVGFLALLFFTIVFYIVYAFVREIVCTVICPYGRLQGVLTDKNSIAVSYDRVRGEPRSKRRSDENAGDCIDCSLCVHVCPTGIDIRNGVQLECINCTACIDACDSMMKKVGRPTGLVRYASENNIIEGKKIGFTYRMKAYTAVLVVLVGLLVTLLVTRSMFDATVLRVPGQVLQEHTDGTISNLYRIRIVNKSNLPQPYQIRLKQSGASIQYVGKALDSLKPLVESEETFFISMPKSMITTRKQKIDIEVLSGEELVQTKEVSFIGEY